MSNVRNNQGVDEKSIIHEEKEVYIYAEVDIDKAFNDILTKSKKIRNYLQDKSLSIDFTEKMRNLKNFVHVAYQAYLL